MELDLTTFVLELVNFLILVWLLKRFLYKPVLDVIQRRRAAIHATLDEAAQTKREAEAASEQYAHRLEGWEQERQHAREELRTEIQQERARLMDELKKELASERRKAAAQAEREAEEWRYKSEEAARRNAAAFASRLLARAAGPELERRVVQAALEDLRAIPPERAATLRENAAEATIWTAHELPVALKQEVEQALHNLAPVQPLQCRFEELPELMAGLLVQLGPWTLQANLRDELAYFAEWGRDVA